MPPSLHLIPPPWRGHHKERIHHPAPKSVLDKLMPDTADSSRSINAYIRLYIDAALSGKSILLSGKALGSEQNGTLHAI
jgi:hypothetical protein